MKTTQSAQPTFFEDFETGQQYRTSKHTVAETEVTAFAQLSGDHNKLHIDPEFAAQTPYRERIAHGLLVMSLVSGLASQLGLLGESVLAFRQLDWKFKKPVYIGDTVRALIAVTHTASVPRLGGGLVRFAVKVFNQHSESVQTGSWRILIRSNDQDLIDLATDG